MEKYKPNDDNNYNRKGMEILTFIFFGSLVSSVSIIIAYWYNIEEPTTIKEAIKAFINEGLWIIIIPPLSLIVVLAGMLTSIVNYLDKKI